jgi:hypothetical protein
MKEKLPMNRILVLAALLFALPAQAVVNIEWVTVREHLRHAVTGLLW